MNCRKTTATLSQRPSSTFSSVTLLGIETRRLKRPPPSHLPGEERRWEQEASPYLGVSQHDVLDLGQPPGLSVLHAYIVDLVATNLAVLAVLDWGAPEHLDGSGVQDLHLNFARRRTGHCEEGKERVKSHLGTSV